METKIKMNVKLKSRWIKALESGKNKQIKGRLSNRGIGRCCLGVLGDVAKVKYKVCSEQDDYDTNKNVYTQISKLLGSYATWGKLSGFNDVREWSFKKIAAWIRREL